jgi:hypothetical protein
VVGWSIANEARVVRSAGPPTQDRLPQRPDVFVPPDAAFELEHTQSAGTKGLFGDEFSRDLPRPDLTSEMSDVTLM